MKTRFFKILKEKKFLVFDGAMGTMLLNYGFKGGCSEQINLDNPNLIRKIQHEYALAGADVIETNTFGGTAIKLSEYGLESRVEEINITAAKIARSICSQDGLVAGSVGPLGRLLEPMGAVTYDEAYAAFAQQMKALEKGGVDVLIIETISDIQEMRAALIAAKNETKLPVICSFTYGENGKTMTGTDFITALNTCQELGADVVSTNCGNGPAQLYKMLEPLAEELLQSKIPLMIMPNAGLPEIEKGKAVYRMEPEEFGILTKNFAKLGFEIFGGCCGTTPQHIQKLKQFLLKDFLAPKKKKIDPYEVFFTSRQKSLVLTKQSPFFAVGERLNPTARKAFASELKEGKTVFLKEEAAKQTQEGAQLIDLNVGVPGIDQVATMKKMLAILSTACTTPVCIDSDDPGVLEEALKTYPGISLVNSVNGKKKSMEQVLPLVKKYGAAVIALALDEKGIPKTAEERIKIIKKIVKTCRQYGIAKEKIFVDTLVMAVATEQDAPQVTLETISLCKKEGLKTCLGVSNVSFGLPKRAVLNNAFLTLARKKGLTAGIVNPATYTLFNDDNPSFQLAKKVLLGKDKGAAHYIQEMGKERSGDKKKTFEKNEKSVLETIAHAVVCGEEESILALVEKALRDYKPQEIISALITGIEKVGVLYETGEYFLPQMVMSANSMKIAFQRVKKEIPLSEVEHKGIAVICTVKGDIHDIGKNIVAMMLENHGFKIIDLGKDVATDTIVKTAIKEKAQLVVLSALLTTTMVEMGKVKKALIENNVSAKVMIGGAVVTPGYAEEINAYYSKDAMGAVRLAKELIDGKK